MNRPTASVFAWTGDPLHAAFFLEELLEELETSKLLSPILVDCQPKRDADLPLDAGKARGLPLKGLSCLAQGKTPLCRIDALAGLWAEALRGGQSGYLEQCHIMFLPQTGDVVKAMALADEILFLAPAVKDSVSALYKLALALNDLKGRSPGVSVVISGENDVEDAANFFLSMREELEGLNLLNCELRFAGNFAIPADKVRLSAATGIAYRDLFRGDAMYGTLKAVGRRWVPCLVPAECCKTAEEFFCQAAKILCP